MAHSSGYPTDIDRKPDMKERSQRKQRSPCDVAVETKKRARLCKHDSYITRYNNYLI